MKKILFLLLPLLPALALAQTGTVKDSVRVLTTAEISAGQASDTANFYFIQGGFWKKIRMDSVFNYLRFRGMVDTIRNQTILGAKTFATAPTFNTALGLASGGTNSTTAQGAINTLAGATTSGQYLRGNGSNVVMSAIQITDVPTLNQNTTGSAATLTNSRTIQTNLASTSAASFNGSANITPGVTGTLQVVNGGTGQSTLAAAGILTGSDGITNYLPKFTGSTTLGNSNIISDASGNLGIGVTPSAWVSGHVGLQVNTGLSIMGSSVNGNFASNCYFAGSNWIYTQSYPATNFYSNFANEGSFVWSTAPAGTPGSNINFTQAMTLNASGRLGIGNTNPGARLHLGAGQDATSGAPLKFTSGTDMSTPEAGAMEWDGTNLHMTNSSNVRRWVNQGIAVTSGTINFAATNGGTHDDETVTVTGATAGDVVSLGVPNGAVFDATCYTAWVSADNTVTIRFNNYSGTQRTPSGVFKIFVTKF